MALPALDLSAMVLATHVTRLYSDLHRLAYAFIKPDLTVVYYSPNFKAVLNDPEQPVLGARLTNLIWEFAGSEYALAAVFAKELSHYELRQIHRTVGGGSSAFLDFYVTALHDATIGNGLLLIVEDVTKETEVEQILMQERNELRLTKLHLSQANEMLEQVNRLKSLFVSMVAHDLRSPLTAIDGYAEILLQTAVSERTDDYLMIISNQAKRLEQIISDLLDLDKIEQGKIKFTFEPACLNNLVAETVEMLQLSLTQKQVDLHLRLGDMVHAIPMDTTRIGQVIYNLLNNAIKYSPRHSQITITTNQNEDETILNVTDTGHGIPAEQMAHLFQLYYRTKDAEASRIPGTGLGLFIVKTFVEAHNGQIQVSSELGQGTTFTVWLPNK